MELKSCPFCPDGGEPKLVDGCYSADGHMDKAWKVRCLKCYATVEKMPEYGEKNYWWRHPQEGIQHMREVIVEKWNTRYNES